MKYLGYFILLLFFLSSCGDSPKPQLIFSDHEAFGFDLGESWEVNSSVTVRGFSQTKNDEKYSAILAYSVDLITPTSDSLFSVYNDKVMENSQEEIQDLILEAQLEVDTSFGEGKYSLIFNVSDEISMLSDTITVDFSLTK